MMGDWGISDILKIAVLGGLGWMIIQSEREADYRPEYIKYVEDPRNGCKIQQELPLFNHMVHVAKAEYKPKILRVYLCANGLTAANISEE